VSLRPRAPVALAVAVSVAVLVLGGCGQPQAGGEDTRSSGGSAGTGVGNVSGPLVVFAASSLTEAFEVVADRFERRHPCVQVTFSFAGSSTLGPQISAGAPADVFASADPRTMRAVVQAGVTAAPPVMFASNRLQIAVPPGNPGQVRGLGDFARDALDLAVCAPEVPCGAAAARAFAAAGVEPRPDTLEQDVKAVLTKVELGEVDAGLVYRTDVRAAGPRVRGIVVPAAQQAVNRYLLAPLSEAANPAAAQAFVQFVRGPRGREALADAGFDLP
jgi:molybdate transport system substrate-binding protein